MELLNECRLIFEAVVLFIVLGVMIIMVPQDMIARKNATHKEIGVFIVVCLALISALLRLWNIA